MSTDVSDVQQERLLARTLVELRESVTRARMLLPALSLQDLIMLAGAVEQAKTEGMKVSGTPSQETKPRRLRPSRPVTTMQPVVVQPVETPKPKLLLVRTDKGDVLVAEAVTNLLRRANPKTVRELLDMFEEKHWKLLTTSPHPAQILRMSLERNDNLFQRIVKKEGDKSVARFARREGKTKRTKGHPRAAKVYIGDQILKALAALTKPISTAELAKKINVERIQSLIPRLVSLRAYGAVKNTQKDGAHYWFPVIDKLQEYDANHNGTAFFSKADAKALNGVSHA
jgi:hypothetical protein